MDAVVYVHGKGGSAVESEHYKTLFPLRIICFMIPVSLPM